MQTSHKNSRQCLTREPVREELCLSRRRMERSQKLRAPGVPKECSSLTMDEVDSSSQRGRDLMKLLMMKSSHKLKKCTLESALSKSSEEETSRMVKWASKELQVRLPMHHLRQAHLSHRELQGSQAKASSHERAARASSLW